MKKLRWVSGAMSVDITAEAGVLEIDFSGLVTPAGIAAFALQAPKMGLPHSNAVMARFDRATVAARAEHFTNIARQGARLRCLLHPGAVVCKQSDYWIFHEHAGQAADHGVVRANFTDVEQAVAWSRKTAQVARLATLRGMQGMQGTALCGYR